MPPPVVPWFVAVSLPGPPCPGRFLRRMAQWCLRFTPRVHVEASDAAVACGAPLVLLDATGSLRVHGGAERLVRRVSRGLARRGILHAIAGASSSGEAVVLATACGLGVPAGDSPSRPSGTPSLHGDGSIGACAVEALRLPEATCAALREVNLCRIGDLLHISRPALADRFGPLPAERLDIALGRAPWPFRAVVPVEPFAEEFAFASPCTHHEAVAAACRDTAARLCARLLAEGRGMGAVRVRIDRARLPPVEGTVHFGGPTRDPGHLWAILRPRLERVHLGRHELGEGVERFELRALRRSRIAATTLPLHGGLGDSAAAGLAATPGRAVAELLDCLRARLGEGSASLVRDLPEGRVPGPEP